MAPNHDSFTVSDDEAFSYNQFPLELVIVGLSLDIEPRRHPFPTPGLHSSSPWYSNTSFPPIEYPQPVSPSIWDNDVQLFSEDPDISGIDEDGLDYDSDAETEPGSDPIYIDNGDRGVTYVAQFGRNYSLYFEMTPINPNERYPRINRRRPLWGDRFDLSEDKENIEHEDDRDTYVFEHSPILIRRPFEPNWTRTHNLPAASPNIQMSSTVRACLFHDASSVLNERQISEEFGYSADGFDLQSSQNEENPNNQIPRADFCVNFQLGECCFGDRCSFAHDATRFPF